MPAIAAVAIPAVAGLAGGVIASRSQNKAAALQNKATNDALNYQRERAGVEDQRYSQRWNDYQQRHAAWEARNFGAKGAPAGGGGGGMAAGPAISLQDLAQGFGNDVQAKPVGQTLQDVSQWNDWARYGV